MIRRPPKATRPYTRFPDTTLFRSHAAGFPDSAAHDADRRPARPRRRSRRSPATGDDMTTQTLTQPGCAPTGGDADPETLRRAITASALGNATEWFDYGIYAYGVTYISAALFPGDTDQAVLYALATFEIGRAHV